MKLPDVTMWQGLGIISPAGLFLEAYGERSEYVLDQHKASPKGSQLVLVTARLEKISTRQIRKAGKIKLGFVVPQTRRPK